VTSSLARSSKSLQLVCYHLDISGAIRKWDLSLEVDWRDIKELVSRSETIGTFTGALNQNIVDLGK
jgi:hypothetical protein